MSDEEDNPTMRRQSLEYHIKTGDYFNTVATALGFLEESLKLHCVEDPALETKEIKLARQLREDLRFLDANYRIEPKT